MDIAAIRGLALQVSRDLYGVAATITPPGDEAIAATGVWLPPLVDEMPVGRDFQRREPRRVMALFICQVGDSLPRGTTVVAAEYGASVARAWKVDRLAEPQNPEQIRVILIPA
ncbi:MAG: hypothetical protein A3H96_11365 [Acidobacteria bacterium RIFCSPLOWO2_02_FULL_67_36]|nr:MAG: hypothetical protein A3H96_11365 [Acidobacteria bacterium RIFCSPLOWO2_02_FULL_67_36]